MAGEKTTLPSRTPAKTPAKSTGSTGKQASILGFFARQTPGSQTPSAAPRLSSQTANQGSSPLLKDSTKSNELPRLPKSFVNKQSTFKRHSNRTPVPSSDVLEAPSSPVNTDGKMARAVSKAVLDSSPTRKGSAKGKVNYAESSDEDDSPPQATQPRRRLQQRKTKVIDDDDDEEYEAPEDDPAAADDDEDMADFVVDDDSDAPTKKRKRSNTKPTSRAPKRANLSSSPERDVRDDDDAPLPDTDTLTTSGPSSTAQQWRFDPNDTSPPEPREKPKAQKKASNHPKTKEKAHTRDPEQRYPWLAEIQDMNRNSPGDPDYDPSTVFVPRSAWNNFSAFETQYWEIKQKLWDTVVFFKKGKFYELYENDATKGHQLFDLKMTDRVNMRMVGVPESSLDMWVNQFVAKGYKVARVDQMESALGKEMRERDGKTPAKSKAKGDKIIRRELACVLTAGTLVDGSMLQDDMAVYCVAIKEDIIDDLPAFGIAFVDAATGQFFLSHWVDDVELTRFETFVAQINPRELILQKSHLSPKALRILKNNTSPLTIWNYRRAGEFWEADKTLMVLNGSNYFVPGGDGEEDEEPAGEPEWPAVLSEAKDNQLVMSAFGGLTGYLEFLKLDKSLISQGNFQWYNPIHKNGTLILDGQTLINLEVFANNINGGAEGTLFQLLNRCVSPFGKRLFRQWVCHPLCNADKINERLDAVDMLTADKKLCGQFSANMIKMPDLERLISRVHAGSCKAEDFVRVIDGFEQIEYTMSLLSAFDGGSRLVDALISSMPNLRKPLDYWKGAFSRKKALEEKMLVPEKGIDEEFDASLGCIEDIKERLHDLLGRQQRELKSKNLKFTNIGKEVYQIETPKSVKVPTSWRQMSATANVKRYYFTELSDLVRELQEAEETHSQLLKGVSSRFFHKFDEDYAAWLAAIRVTSQLDCLISLAKASESLGYPSCRPEFLSDERSIVDFEELCHPCMQTSVDDFIPNSISLGGNNANINLLTGANAAGKSTVLRMSCIAVIMAQIGCRVPAVSARLTPVDRIMSRLGANDNIFAAQSTFFVELSETKKILAEATSRSLVILDELGRGTSSYDGVAVAQAVLHHVATHVGCIGFFATHYHSLACEFAEHPEINEKRMAIEVDDKERRVTFLYKLEDGVAEGSFGMHCASMCGIPGKVVERAEVAAKEWEHTSRLRASLERAKGRGMGGEVEGGWVPLGVISDVAAVLRGGRRDEGGLEGLLEGLVRGVGML